MTIQTLFVTTVLCGVIIGSEALAKPPADDLLAGPTIVDEEVTNNDMAEARQRVTGSTVSQKTSQQFWMQTLRSIELTEDQKVVIQGIVKEHETLGREFHRIHGEELNKLRKAAQATREEGKPVPKEIRTRMHEIMELAPDASIFQDKAWKALTPDQQNNFKLKYQSRIDLELTRRAENEEKLRSPKKDTMQERGFGPKDSKFRDTRIDPMDDLYVRSADALDDASLRRIKFLRHLQELHKE